MFSGRCSVYITHLKSGGGEGLKIEMKENHLRETWQWKVKNHCSDWTQRRWYAKACWLINVVYTRPSDGCASCPGLLQDRVFGTSATPAFTVYEPSLRLPLMRGWDQITCFVTGKFTARRPFRSERRHFGMQACVTAYIFLLNWTRFCL